VARELGADPRDVEWFAVDVHKNGPWSVASRLANKKDAAAQAYLVLAAACHDAGRTGFAPSEYAADRERIIAELAGFEAGDLEKRLESIRGRIIGEVSGLKVKSKQSVRAVRVSVASGEPALPLAMRGEFGCVSESNGEYAAQAAAIFDSSLMRRGLRKGYGEVLDSATGKYRRVAADTPGSQAVWVDAKDGYHGDLNKYRPAAKQISKGCVWTYGDRNLAASLAADSIRAGETAEFWKKIDAIKIPERRNLRSPEMIEHYQSAHAERLRLFAEHFGGTYETLNQFPGDLKNRVKAGNQMNHASHGDRMPFKIGRLDVGNKTFIYSLNGVGMDLFVDGTWRGGNHGERFLEMYESIDRDDRFGING
jgi:hypothetical protein